MRSLPSRPPVPATTQTQLRQKTALIEVEPAGPQRVKKAHKVYDHSRKSKWFAPVVQALRSISGDGELCMYCSTNEPSQIDHYRPLKVFPELAMKYENYLWTCDICNRSKLDRFPPDTEAGARILNPLDDDVWEFFFLDDRFGRLISRVNPDTGEALPRATSTCRVVGIDRENLQTRRMSRYKALRANAERTLAELDSDAIDPHDVAKRIDEWLSEPFQADVADYFLQGPGGAVEPFRSLLQCLA